MRIVNAGLILLLSIFALSIKAQVSGVDKFNHLNFVEADDMQGIKDRKEAERYREMGLLIDMPAGYQKLRKLSPFILFGYGQIEHLVFNKDSTFLIGISVETVDSADYFSEEDVLLMRDKRAFIVSLRDDLTRSYLDQANLVDSPQFKPFRYSESRLKKYHADQGIEFCKPSSYHDFGKYGNYKLARSIILHKKRQGNLQIHYYAKQGAEADVEKVVRKSTKMFRFINIEQSY